MTTHKEFYYILTFNTTTDAMCADKCAKENTNGIRAALMPLPQEFKSGCGFALRFLDDNLEAILKFCKTSPFKGKLFKMHTKGSTVIIPLILFLLPLLTFLNNYSVIT